MDPCLFVIDRYSDDGREPNSKGQDAKGTVGTAMHELNGEPLSMRQEIEDVTELPPGVSRSWVLIHTDDCDAYGMSNDVLHEINNIMHEEWSTEIVDSSFVLGVKRTTGQDSKGRWYRDISMTTFIDDLCNLFQDDLDEFAKPTVRTPFPENTILTKATTPDEGEVKRNINRGYQRLVGSLLWCVRHVAPICAYGCSQLCKLMACPTDTAWACALHMLRYLQLNRERGIRFSETSDAPMAFVDASNKDDPTDGKTQYGYSIMWGGPLATKSGKLKHVGINSTYNEYMALHHCIKQVVWTRQLLEEIGLRSVVNEPTIVFADNKQANNLCKEDLVTAGNMYFRTGYHYNKEAVKDGYVDVKYIKTDHNISDACTKALGSNKVKSFEPALHGFKPLPLNDKGVIHESWLS